MPATSWVLSLAVLLTTAPPSTTEAPKGDLAKLQGKWSAKAGPNKDIELSIEIKGQTVVAKATLGDGQEFELKGEIALNEEAKPHKTIDWTKFNGPDGQAMPDNPGIYTFENADEVTICNGGPGKERPSEFKAGDGEDPQLFSLKREKAAEKDKEKDKDAPKGDLAKFQGAWTAKVGPNEDIEIVLNIKGNDVDLGMSRDGEERTVKGKIVIDEVAKPHPSITFKGFQRPDGTEAPENLGIYAIEGTDTIKVCTGGPGNERPTEMKAGEGGPPNLITLKRKPN